MNNKIFIELDYINNQISFNSNDLEPRQANLSFKIIKGENPETVSFGFRFYAGSELKETNEYNFVSLVTSPNYIIEPPIHLEKTIEHRLIVWMSHQGNTIEAHHTVANLIPPQIYPSWQWNNATKEWDPPIPFPGTDKPWSWNESQKKWVVLNDYS